MATVKRIELQQTIQASVEIVWEKMFAQNSFPLWTKAFCEGSHYEGSWNKGDRIRFLDPDKNGMIAIIADRRDYEYLSIKHLGYIYEGVEDTTSETVRAWAPAYENYTFSASPGSTSIKIEQDVIEEYEQFMRDAWPNALHLLKQLCET